MSHYSMGYYEVEHRGKLIRTTVGEEQADRLTERINNQPNSSYTTIPNGLAHRPDLIANKLYDDPDKIWLLCLGSNRFDVFEDFEVGAKINLL